MCATGVGVQVPGTAARVTMTELVIPEAAMATGVVTSETFAKTARQSVMTHDVRVTESVQAEPL
jgi:hypothetical protein